MRRLEIVKKDTYIWRRTEAIRVLYKGTEFKITQRPFDIFLNGGGNIQGIFLKKTVGIHNISRQKTISC